MIARMRMGMGAFTAVAVVVLALWVWGRSGELAALLAVGASRPDMEIWAVRCGAIAAVAGAQLLLMRSVVAAVFSERAIDELTRLVLGLLASSAALGAMVLAIMGR